MRRLNIVLFGILAGYLAVFLGGEATLIQNAATTSQGLSKFLFFLQVAFLVIGFLGVTTFITLYLCLYVLEKVATTTNGETLLAMLFFTISSYALGATGLINAGNNADPRDWLLAMNSGSLLFLFVLMLPAINIVNIFSRALRYVLYENKNEYLKSAERIYLELAGLIVNTSNLSSELKAHRTKDLEKLHAELARICSEIAKLGKRLEQQNDIMMYGTKGLVSPKETAESPKLPTGGSGIPNLTPQSIC